MVDGVPMVKHLRQLEEQLTKQGLEGPSELALPEFPEALERTWAKFLELAQSRSSGFDGPLPITYADMYYWSKITKSRLSQLELKIIRRLDAIWFEVVKD